MDQNVPATIVIDGNEFKVAELKVGDIIGDPKKGTGYKYLGGKGKWMNFENLQTGEQSIQTHNLKKVSNWDECEHFWELKDSNGNIQCTNCELGQRIVWGKQIIKNGQIYNLKPKS